MATKAELEQKFWKAIKKDMTVMLGVAGFGNMHAPPMTAQLDPEHQDESPIYFFTAKDNDIVEAIKKDGRATAHFAAKDHDLFACIHGTLALDDDRLAINRLWNPFVAAWFKGGKDDPKLQLLRLDATTADIWLNENSVFAGIRMMLGSDPKQDYASKVGEVSLT
jgi:general stress protein 26